MREVSIVSEVDDSEAARSRLARAVGLLQGHIHVALREIQRGDVDAAVDELEEALRESEACARCGCPEHDYTHDREDGERWKRPWHPFEGVAT